MTALTPTLYYWGEPLTEAPFPKPLILFDLDSTLIRVASTTRGGKQRVHPKDATDWAWLRPDVPSLLASYLADYSVVIHTNQGSEMRVQRVAAVMQALRRFLREHHPALMFHLECFAAAAHDQWRKPNSTLYERYLFPRLPPTQEVLLVIGDAAGRADDFSDSDRALAFNIHHVTKYLPYRGTIGGRNLSVLFSTPEQYFWNEEDPRPRRWLHTDPRQWLQPACDCGTAPCRCLFSPDALPLTHVRAVILVGPQGSGKSRLAGLLAVASWQVVSSDELGTPARCRKRLAELCAENPRPRLVVDATSPALANRAALYEILAEGGVPPAAVLVVHMALPRELVLHLHIYRERVTDTPRLSEVALRHYYSVFEPPQAREWQDYPARVVHYGWSPVNVVRAYFCQRLL